MSSPAPTTGAFLIVGEQEFLASRHQRALTPPGIVRDVFSAKSLDPNDFLGATSPSLFAEQRVVVVTDLKGASSAALDLVESALAALPDSVILIGHYAGPSLPKRLQAWQNTGVGVTLLDAAPLRRDGLLSFVDQEFRSHRVRVTPEVRELIIHTVGTDLRELASAISQLVADTGGQVGTEEVLQYYTGQAEVNNFDLADAVINGNVSRAVATIRRALQIGESPVRIVYALTSAFADLAKLVEPQRPVNPSTMSMPQWKLTKLRSAARNWYPWALSLALGRVAELDRNIKGGSAVPEYQLEATVRDLALLARGEYMPR